MNFGRISAFPFHFEQMVVAMATDEMETVSDFKQYFLPWHFLWVLQLFYGLFPSFCCPAIEFISAGDSPSSIE